jgi:predicted nucleotidyltransferase
MTENRPILSLGRFLPLSPDGFLVNDCLSEISHPWDKVVAAFRQKAREVLRPQLHSIYVRGSVARGLTIDGVSDLDALAVVTSDVGTWVKTEWPRAFGEELKQMFPFCDRLDVAFLDYWALLNSDRGADYRFMIKTQSICIDGEDLGVLLPNFFPDLTIAFGCRCMSQDVIKFFDRFATESDPRELRAWCAWIMRKLLRVAGELAMLKSKHYSRDLSLCREAYCELNPSCCEDVQNALRLAVNPSFEHSEVLPVVRRLSAQFKMEFYIASATEKPESRL